MIRYLYIFALILGMIILSAIPMECYAQGKVTRPSKSNSHNNHPQKTQPIQNVDPIQRYNDSIAKLPREEEYINNLLVRWRADVTNEQKEAITTIIDNLVDIQGGTFIMGSDTQNEYFEWSGKRYYVNGPSHSERAKTFKLSKYEVTQKIWESIMGNNPSRFWGDDFPVTNVSWCDCQSFINTIKQLSDIEFRLPTEVEWEYVARKNLPDGSGYNEYIAKTEWTSNGKDKMPHSVGTKECNSFGVYDIIGNVREWTSDHASLDYNHPRNLSSYNVRGCTYASWDHVYSRINLNPYSKNDVLGFRLAF